MYNYEKPQAYQRKRFRVNNFFKLWILNYTSY